MQLVDFFVGTTLIGTRTVAPFTVTWTNSAIGTYTLTARAVDNEGAETLSAPVTILVTRNVSGAIIAIIRNEAHPEIDRVQEYLLDLGLSSQVFDQDGLTVEDLAGFQLVIWDDTGATGLTANNVIVMQQLSQSGVALYFIGERLASSASSLPASQRSQWSGLTRLAAVVDRFTPQTVIIDQSSGHNAVNGRFGTVGNFAYARDVDRTTGIGVDEIVLGTSGPSDVVVAADPGGGIGRIVSQNVLVTGGEDVSSLAERRRLFKNSVGWLLRRGFSALTDLSLSLAGPTGTVPAGQELTYTWTLRHRGEVESSGVTLLINVPIQLRYLRAEFTQGNIVATNGTVTYSLGTLANSEVLSVKVVFLASTAGEGTITSTVNGNEPDPNPGNNNATAVIEIQGSISQSARLEVTRSANGRFEGLVRGEIGRSYVIEFSTNLINWTTLTTFTATGPTMPFSDSITPGAARRFYRVREL